MEVDERLGKEPLSFFSVGSTSGGVHRPVLKKEAIANLKIKKSGIYVDATLGEGGHAEGILRKLGPKGCLVGIDWDEEAIEQARRRLSSFRKQVIFVRENYKELPGILKQLKIAKIDGILLDLGVSSLQLESRHRGFSFRLPSLLDMRMDRRKKLKAGNLINKLSENDLKKIFFQFGEERYSKRIAKRIVQARKMKPVETTLELAEIVKAAFPGRNRFQRIHPATRIFQALRIAVNRELDNLRVFLEESICFLNKGGRIAVISYHSLEDRIVKRFFKDSAKTCLCPQDFPVCRCEIHPQLKIITARPVKPEENEIKSNPRSRSAKLRIAEKI